MNEATCTKCKTQCRVDGEYPKFFAWCNTCNDYSEGFDPFEYAAEHRADLIDRTYDAIKEHGYGG